jgi:metal-responsive CopG/Arc/MetJ family transcriptional regulator
MASIPVPQKKRGRPATGETPRVPVRLAYDLIAGVDTFAAEEKINRSDAIRTIIRDWLIGHGYLEAPPEDAN